MIKVKVNAKINLSLYVGKPTGGYHSIDSVVASVDIADVISAYKSDEFSLEFASGITAEKTNSYKAARYMAEEYLLSPFSLFIEDNIPSACGLGGSSADCSGVILAVNKLFSLNLTLSQMQEIALKFGSDTAYMLQGGYARMQGRGEVITPFDGNYFPEITVAYQGEVSTKDCFDAFDEIGRYSAENNNDLLIELLKRGADGIDELLVNDLLEPAMVINPHVGRIIECSGSYAKTMTGSGSAVVIFGYDQALEDKLKELGSTVIRTRIVKEGVHIEE